MRERERMREGSVRRYKKKKLGGGDTLEPLRYKGARKLGSGDGQLFWNFVRGMNGATE